MKSRLFLGAVGLAALIGFVAGSAFTEEDEPSEAEMMKLMMELAKPGEAHKAMGPFIGEWTVDSRMWMKPDQPIVSKASATTKWFLGGRFLKMRYEGDWQGMPFEGMGLMGYDNFKKEYVGIWVDNMGSGIQSQTGKGLEGGGIELHSVWEGPMGKIPGRMVYSVVDKDTWKMESWMTMGEQESKNIELVFKRKKAAAASEGR